MSRGHNRKGRSTNGGAFVQLHHFMMKTEAWRSLSTQQRAVYVELAAIYNGANNGFLGLSVRRAAERCNISKNTAAICFEVLEVRGFIECVTPGGFSRKTRHSTEWRLTSCRCDKSGVLPTKAFVRWKPEQTGSAAPIARYGAMGARSAIGSAAAADELHAHGVHLHVSQTRVPRTARNAA
jgi:hypothetical protein